MIYHISTYFRIKIDLIEVIYSINIFVIIKTLTLSRSPSLSTSDGEANLHDLNLRVDQGSLVAVVGTVGRFGPSLYFNKFLLQVFNSLKHFR